MRVGSKLRRPREEGMKVSRSKTEYMCVNEREDSGMGWIQAVEVVKVD